VYLDVPTSSCNRCGLESMTSAASNIDGIFPGLPFSRREVKASTVSNFVDSHHGSGGRQVTSSSGDFRLMIADFSFRKAATSPAMGQGFLKFHYKLNGKNAVRFANRPEMLLESGRSAMVLHPEGLSKDDSFAADVRELSVTIGCRRDSVLGLLGLSSDELPKRARRYFECSESDFCSDELPLNIKMAEALNSLINPTFAPWLQRLHTEAKVVELISLSLNELTRLDFTVGPNSYLKPRDVSMLHAVHEFLQTNIGGEITIAAICEKFGTNRAKLSAGYKALFGETLFEYLHKLRMDHAMVLILNTQMTISDIAEKVGYHHQSSFSTAFRDYHGTNPLSARRT
jgi:AraC-like DNA-binding protein